MKTKTLLYELRMKAGLSQDELAEKVYVTRQAVSRWETGETIPGIETLKLLSKLYNVSINTLLDSPYQMVCQCCGMPMDDTVLSKDQEGFFNEEFCKWCYVNGKVVYDSLEEIVDFCYEKSNHFKPAEQLKKDLRHSLSQLNYWKQYKELGGIDDLNQFKNQLIKEINAFDIEGMPEVHELISIKGHHVNAEFMLPNGSKMKFLDDQVIYLGALSKCIYDEDSLFTVVAGMDFLLVFSSDYNGQYPELLVYKKR